MRVLIVGAGVVGTASAYYLAERGCEVTLVDAGNAPAGETSHANGGQLSWTFSDALASPGFLKRIPALLLGRETGCRIRLEPGLFGWGLRFLAQCTRRKADRNTLATLRRGLRSALLMQSLREHTGIEFHHRRAGKMLLIETPEQRAAAEHNIALKQTLGCDNRLIDYEEALAIEPALARFDRRPQAAVYSPGDEVGDARQFSTALCAWLTAHRGLVTRFGERVLSVNRSGGCISGVTTDRETLAADAVVLCCGPRSNALLTAADARLPIYPMRGYSLTLPTTEASPNVSLTVLSRQFVFSRLNGHIRVAGFADFRGFDDRNDAGRVAELRQAAREVAPEAANYDSREQQPWGGFRPMTPDGQAHVRATRVRGLYVNAGHGMLGWTLACDSGERAAQVVTGGNSQ